MTNIATLAAQHAHKRLHGEPINADVQHLLAFGRALVEAIEGEVQAMNTLDIGAAWPVLSRRAVLALLQRYREGE